METVLVLGGTGSIGAAVLRELAARGKETLVLARSATAAAKARALGATAIIEGDIEASESWVGRLPPLGAVIHMACDFARMAGGETERRLLDNLLPHLPAQSRAPRFLYTGGCWLFGATGDRLATEASPFDPLPAFAWMVPHAQRILAHPALHGIVIHPGMVYGDRGSGVFARFFRDAVERPAIRVVGAASIRWPLVHRDDLATLYALALDAAPAHSSYLAVAHEGLAVGQVAHAFARRFHTSRLEAEIMSANSIAGECGEWARGYALDQRLSGAKARAELGWMPRHQDPEGDIAQIHEDSP